MRAQFVIALAASASAFAPLPGKPYSVTSTRGAGQKIASAVPDEPELEPRVPTIGVLDEYQSQWEVVRDVALAFASGTLKAHQLFDVKEDDKKEGIAWKTFKKRLGALEGLEEMLKDKWTKETVKYHFSAKDEKGKPTGRYFSNDFNFKCSAVLMEQTVEKDFAARFPGRFADAFMDFPDILGEQRNHSKLIAVVAHNRMKAEMKSFIAEEKDFFLKRRIVSTNTTGSSIKEILNEDFTDKEEEDHLFKLVESGPLGGDQEVGAYIAQGKCAAAFFFIDPLTIQSHDADIKALQRLCDVHNIPVATNRASGKNLAHSLRYNADQIIKMHENHTEPDSYLVQLYKTDQLDQVPGNN